jgi:hypothetical protein
MRGERLVAQLFSASFHAEICLEQWRMSLHSITAGVIYGLKGKLKCLLHHERRGLLFLAVPVNKDFFHAITPGRRGESGGM